MQYRTSYEPLKIFKMTMQPARHACSPLQAEKQGIQPVVGDTHYTRV